MQHTCIQNLRRFPSRNKRDRFNEVGVNAQLSSGGQERPCVAFAMGDPAGISPELAAKLLASTDLRAAAQIIVFGDQRILRGGADVAGVSLDLDVVGPDAIPNGSARPVMVDLGTL